MTWQHGAIQCDFSEIGETGVIGIVLGIKRLFVTFDRKKVYISRWTLTSLTTDHLFLDI